MSPQDIPLSDLLDIDALVEHLRNVGDLADASVTAFIAGKHTPTPLADGRLWINRGSTFCDMSEEEALRYHWECASAAMNPGSGPSCQRAGGTVIDCFPLNLEYVGEVWPKAYICFSFCPPPFPKQSELEALLTIPAEKAAAAIEMFEQKLLTDETYAMKRNTIAMGIKRLSGQISASYASIVELAARRKAEDELKSEYVFREAIADSVPVGVIAMDMNGVMTYANRAFCEMIDYSHDEVMASEAPRPWWHVDDIEPSIEAFRRTLAGDIPQQGFDLRLMRRNGERIDCRVNPGPLMDSCGIQRGWLTTVTDVTQRKRAEEQLFEERDFRRAIEDSTAACLAAFDTDGRLTYVNRAFCELVGWSADELIGSVPPRVFWPEEDVESLSSVLQDTLEGVLPTDGVDERFRRRSGELLDVHVKPSAMIDASGRHCGWMVSAVDVTNRKRMEDALRRSEERYRSIFDSVGEGIVIRDLDDSLLYANPEYCRFLGYALDELIGTRLDKVIHPDSLDRAREHYKQIPDAGEVREEFRFVRADGATFDAEVYATPHVYEGKRTNLVIMRDVSDRVRALAELRKKAERLQLQHAKLKALTERKANFFTMMSHELRTPMTSIVGFTELLLEDSSEPLSPGQQELLLKVSKNSYRLLDMVNNLLDMSRIESKRLSAFISPLNLDALVDMAVADLKPLAAGKGLDLIVCNDGSGIATCTDEEKFYRILLNLLTNAIKFTQVGRITVIAKATVDNIVVSVSDTGIGIPKWEMRKIFDEFHTAADQAKQKAPGVGLGLPITKKLCELLGGKISVTSKVGQGSTFTVTLPNRSSSERS